MSRRCSILPSLSGQQPANMVVFGLMERIAGVLVVCGTGA